MNRYAEMTLYLGKVSANDRRTIGKADVEVWVEALEGVDLSLANEALIDHVRNRAEQWFTPTHVLTYIRALHKQRMRDAGPPDYPSDLTQAQERDYRNLWLSHVKRGSPAAEATALTDEALHHSRGALVAAPPGLHKALDQFAADRTIR